MKRKFNRIISLILCLAMFCSFSTVASAASAGLSLSLDPAEAEAGKLPSTVSMTIGTTEALSIMSFSGEAYSSDARITISAIKDGDKDLSAVNVNTGRFAYMTGSEKAVTNWATVEFSVPENLPAGTYTLGVRDVLTSKSDNSNPISGITEKSVTFTVTAPSFELTADKINIADAGQYTGVALTPAVTVDGLSPADYIVEYSNNIGAGDEASVTVKPAENGKYTFEPVTKNFTIAKASISPAVSLDGWTYGETANVPVISGDNIDPNAVTYKYKLASAADSEYVLAKPSDAGSYVVMATVAETANYLGGTATANFTIAQKSIEDAVIGTVADATFTGSEIKPQPTVKVGDTTLVAGVDFEYSYSNNVNVGQATVIVTGKGNYTDSAIANFEITQGDAQVTMTGADLSKTYDGTAVSTAGITVNQPGDGAVTFKFYDSEGKEISAPSDAGTYTVKAFVAANGNFKAAESAPAQFIISKADITPVVTIQGWTYGETAKNPSVTSGNPGEGGVTYTYAVKGTTNFSETVPTDADEYTVKAVVAGTTNYNSGTATAEFTIAQKELTVDTTGITVTKVYDGTTAAGTVSGNVAVNGKVGDDVINVTAKAGAYADKNVGADKTVALTFTLSGADAGNYKLKNNTANVAGAITAAPYTYEVDETQNVKVGSDLTALTAPAKGTGVNNEEVTGTLDWYTEDGKKADADTLKNLKANDKVTLTWKFTPDRSNTNYDLTEKTGSVEVTAVAKKTQTITASNVNVTYGDTNKAVSATTTAGGGAITYAVTEGTCVAVNATTGALEIKGAGTAKITVSAAENDTYAKATKVITVTVAKAKLTIEAKDQSIKVGQTVPALGSSSYTVSGLKYNDQFARLGVTVDVKYDKTPDNTKAGTYAIVVTTNKVETDNYKIDCKNGTLTITKKSDPITPPVDPQPPVVDCPCAKFTDVNRNLWYHEGIDYVILHELMNGVSSDRFAPLDTTNRAMIVTILWRLEGEPAGADAGFADVADGQWYSEAIDWAAENGIVTGYSAEKFGPMDYITREQMAAILYRYADYKGYDMTAGENTNILSYTDAEAVSEYAVTAMQWAVGEGLINGVEGNVLAPQGTAIRAQVATILMRFCENIVK